MSGRYEQEYLPLNGTETYLLRMPAGAGRPVLLYLHGGPGETVAPFCHYIRRRTGNLCELWTYDQRGTGRTFLKNETLVPTLPQLLEDLHGVIAHIKAVSGAERVALLGHSWGSVLGSLYALEHPEDLLCYIGVGQLIDGWKNEEACYRALEQAIEAAHSDEDRAALLAIGDYPGSARSPFVLEKMYRVRRLQKKYGLAMKLDAKFFFAFLSAPTLRRADISALKRADPVNRGLIEKDLMAFSLYDRPAVYGTPVFYILGGRDFQTPYPLAQAYFDTIEAPLKRQFMLPKSGHAAPIEDTRGFVDALREIFAFLP